MSNIEQFIEKFKKGFDSECLEEAFTNGNCYHFAVILNRLFGGFVYYSQIQGHFINVVDGHGYDITGMVEINEEDKYDSLYAIHNKDKLLHNRLMDDCVYLRSR